MADSGERISNKKAKLSVWQYFGLRKDTASNDIVKNIAVCDKCGMNVKYSGGKYFSEIMTPQMYNETKTRVKEDLAKADMVALTTDGWSSRSTESYMTVTSVHINHEWKMINHVLQTRILPENHTGEHVAKVLVEAVEEWNLPKHKGQPPLVTDNASNMIKAATVFQTILHVGCYAHTINLACQKSLKVRRLSHLLACIKQVVAYFHRSNIAAALLKSKAELLSLPQRKLIMDVVTRWNSTHDMLVRFLEMQVAMFAVLRSKGLAKEKRDFKAFSDDDLTLLEDVIQLLKPFKDITLALCSEKTPTVSYIMPLQHQLLANICTSSEEDSPTIREMKVILVNDLKSRYSSQQDILNLCSSLDPRFKFLPYLSDDERFDVYNKLASESAKLKDPKPPVLPHVKEDPLTTVHIAAKSTLTSLELCDRDTGPSNSSAETVVCDLTEAGSTPKKIKCESQSASHILDSIFGDVYICGQEPPRSPHAEAEDEVKRYRDLPSIAFRECPLAWWKSHENSLPLLSRLAKQYLCIPGTSVASERVFSTAGDILTAPL